MEAVPESQPESVENSSADFAEDGEGSAIEGAVYDDRRLTARQVGSFVERRPVRDPIEDFFLHFSVQNCTAPRSI